MNIYTLTCIALCGALLWAATGCGNGADDESACCAELRRTQTILRIYGIDEAVLRAELCDEGRQEYCDE